jgi:hypothetical protein
MIKAAACLYMLPCSKDITSNWCFAGDESSLSIQHHVRSGFFPPKSAAPTLEPRVLTPKMP